MFPVPVWETTVICYCSLRASLASLMSVVLIVISPLAPIVYCTGILFKNMRIYCCCQTFYCKMTEQTINSKWWLLKKLTCLPLFAIVRSSKITCTTHEMCYLCTDAFLINIRVFVGLLKSLKKENQFRPINFTCVNMLMCKQTLHHGSLVNVTNYLDAPT